MAEVDNMKRKEVEDLGRKKKIDVKDFLLMQMGGSSVITESAATLPGLPN